MFHFAAQVAVTTSLVDPARDFDVNARGTLEVLEALRASATPAPLLFTSTNKVYGGLADIALRRGRALASARRRLRARGIDERRPLEFRTPYGCSKGAADQYVLDYARSFGLPATVFRMSCIYGPRQFGTEDQGWVAHFLIRALAGEPITIYGDGRQVRDVLFVDDLVDAFMRAWRADRGDPRPRVQHRRRPREHNEPARPSCRRSSSSAGSARRSRIRTGAPGDQRYYVSDTRALRRATGWAPSIPCDVGLAASSRGSALAGAKARR